MQYYEFRKLYFWNINFLTLSGYLNIPWPRKICISMNKLISKDFKITISKIFYIKKNFFLIMRFKEYAFLFNPEGVITMKKIVPRNFTSQWILVALFWVDFSQKCPRILSSKYHLGKSIMLSVNFKIIVMSENICDMFNMKVKVVTCPRIFFRKLVCHRLVSVDLI